MVALATAHHVVHHALDGLVHGVARTVRDVEPNTLRSELLGMGWTPSRAAGWLPRTVRISPDGPAVRQRPRGPLLLVAPGLDRFVGRNAPSAIVGDTRPTADYNSPLESAEYWARQLVGGLRGAERTTLNVRVCQLAAFIAWGEQRNRAPNFNFWGLTAQPGTDWFFGVGHDGDHAARAYALASFSDIEGCATAVRRTLINSSHSWYARDPAVIAVLTDSPPSYSTAGALIITRWRAKSANQVSRYAGLYETWLNNAPGWESWE